MVSENLKDWIKERRDDGVSEERIKKSLKETGHDPSIVDELDDPFDGQSTDKEPSEDIFNSDDQGSKSVESSSDSSAIDTESLEGKEGTESDTSENSGSSRLPNTPSFSLPSTLSFSLPSAQDISRKRTGAALVLLVLLVGGAGFYSFMPSNIDTGFTLSSFLGSDIAYSDDKADLETVDEQYSGCPDVGVRIKSVSSSEGVTTADVLVTRNEAQVVLEVSQDGEFVGFSSKSLEGEDSMTVNAVGDKVTLRPAGCQKFHSERSY